MPTMPGVAIPDGGIALGAPPPLAGNNKLTLHGKQAMWVSFDPLVLDEILKHEGGLKITFGKSMRLIYGAREVEVRSSAEPNRHELYRAGAGDDDDAFGFAGTFTHQLDVRDVDVDSDTADESRLALQASYRRINEEKVASSTVVVDNPRFPPHARRTAAQPKKRPETLRKTPYPNLQARTLGNGRKPSKSPPAHSEREASVGNAEKSANLEAKLTALRTPLVHLLAMGPDSEQNLASRTRVSEEVCLQVLRRIGNKNSRLWALVDDAYRDLEIWDFPYPTKANRDAAIANSREAFHRLRLPSDAPEWKKLVGPDGEGRVDNEPPQPKKPASKAVPPPRIKVTGDGAGPLRKSPPPGKKPSGGEPMSRSTSQTKVGMSGKDAITRIISKKGRKPAVPKAKVVKAPKAASVKLTKAAAAREVANSKIKSAERVVDSDEDIEMEDVKMVPAKPVDKKKPTPTARPAPGPAAKKTPSVSSAAASDMDNRVNRPKPTKPLPNKVQKPAVKKPRKATVPRPTASAVIKGNGPNVQPPKKVLKPAPAQEAASRRSSSNSPSKPSPLGSSPPINASDAGGITASSSPSVMTSLAGTATPGRSPLDPAPPLKASRPRYVPSPSPPLKRKATSGADRDDPYSSKQGGKSAGRSHPGNSSGSASSSSLGNSTKRRNRGPDEDTMKLAREFRQDYEKYESLYREVQALGDTPKRQEKFDKVVSMHHRLEHLKTRITLASVH